jgi:REP-associated tyrosine transposase
MPPASIREKPHRLPRNAYVGRVNVAFTACVADRQNLFDEDVVSAFVDTLRQALSKFDCSAPVYCFMPDHLHVIIQGDAEHSDTRAAMAAFKQKSGFWLSRHRPGRAWQKDFWDHALRCDEDLGAQVRYIAENPVRKGLVRCWRDYPFTGAIGHDLGEILADAAALIDK